MRVLVFGSRAWRDKRTLFHGLNLFHDRFHHITELHHGNNGNADLWADEWGKIHGIPTFPHDAAWGELDKNAGISRNVRMFYEAQPEACLGFPLGGRGSPHMALTAAAGGVPVWLFREIYPEGWVRMSTRDELAL